MGATRQRCETAKLRLGRDRLGRRTAGGKFDARWAKTAKAHAWPALAALALASFVPVILLCLTSLHPEEGMAQVGSQYTFGNFRAFFGSTYTREILINTAVLSFVTVAVSLIIGYPVAYWLARTRSRYRNLVLLMVLAPLLVSAVVRNIGWLPIISADGILNWLLLQVGLIRSPLALTNGFFAVDLALINALLPFMVLTLMTVIQKVGVDLEEAAQNLGASPLETFFKVTLPLSKPGIVSGSLLLFSMAMSAYTTPAIMGGNKANVVSIYIAQQFGTSLQFANGATGAVLLLGVATIVSLTILGIGRRQEGTE